MDCICQAEAFISRSYTPKRPHLNKEDRLAVTSADGVPTQLGQAVPAPDSNRYLAAIRKPHLLAVGVGFEPTGLLHPTA